MLANKDLAARVPLESAGHRFDKVIAEIFKDFSRSALQNWLAEGRIRIDSVLATKKSKVVGGELVTLSPHFKIHDQFEAEDIEISVVYEDSELLVLDKPVGMVVHPAAGNWSHTILNALLFRYPKSRGLPRAGIVHRLDKDTGGLMVVAKTHSAYVYLTDLLHRRDVSRIYRALTCGISPGVGEVGFNIGRDPYNRKRMSALDFGGKVALTRFKLLQAFRFHSYLECELETGRTHQIRVHLSKIGLPLLGDKVYGNCRFKCTARLESLNKDLPRQMLHARSLSFKHPDGRDMHFSSELPEDFKVALSILNEDLRASSE